MNTHLTIDGCRHPRQTSPTERQPQSGSLQSIVGSNNVQMSNVAIEINGVPVEQYLELCERYRSMAERYIDTLQQNFNLIQQITALNYEVMRLKRMIEK